MELARGRANLQAARRWKRPSRCSREGSSREEGYLLQVAHPRCNLRAACPQDRRPGVSLWGRCSRQDERGCSAVCLGLLWRAKGTPLASCRLRGNSSVASQFAGLATHSYAAGPIRRPREDGRGCRPLCVVQPASMALPHELRRLGQLVRGSQFAQHFGALMCRFDTSSTTLLNEQLQIVQPWRHVTRLPIS